MTIKIILDSSFVFALNSPKDKNHIPALQIALLKNVQFFLPDVALTEVTQLMQRDSGLGQKSVISFLKGLSANLSTSTIILLPVQEKDVRRASEVMEQYLDNKLDFVDCCIVSIAERLHITHICTFDIRDFRRFRPKHVSHFTLLPDDLPSR